MTALRDTRGVLSPFIPDIPFREDNVSPSTASATVLRTILSKRARLLVSVCLLTSACVGDAERLPTLRGLDAKNAHTIVSAARARAEMSTAVTAEEFQARNPMRHIGRAHSAGLRQFLHEYTNAGKGRQCQSLRRAWSNTKIRIGSDTARMGIQDHDARKLDSLMRSMCLPKVRIRTASFEAPASPVVALLRSGDPQPYFTAIETAIDVEGATPQLVSVISAIVDDAEGALSGDELEAVYATSSVAVDSYNYWVNQNGVQVTVDSLSQVYGDCVNSEDPNDCFYEEPCVNEDPNDCTWETSLPGDRRVDPKSLYRLASALPRAGCADGFSVKGIIKSDFLGAAAGFFVANVPGIAVGALGGSAMESLWQISRFIACIFVM